MKIPGRHRTFFKILYPDISISQEENAHRQALLRVILPLYGGGKDDKIATQLREERIKICDAHFNPEDIITKGSKKSLKVGAIPVLELPVEPTTSRCPTKQKVDSVVEKRTKHHGCQADIWNSLKKLSSGLKYDWVFYTKGLGLITELQQRSHIMPKIRLEFDDNASLCQASVYGWNVPISMVTVKSLQFRTLASYLKEMGTVRICQGMSKKLLKWNVHPICEWDGNKITYKEISRSPECLIIVGFGRGKYLSCEKCNEFEQFAGAKLCDEEVCAAYGCNKRYKGISYARSDSEGSSDEESVEKRKHPRTFYEFPSDLYLKRMWVVNIRRKDWYPIDSSRICSDHFKEEDMIRYQGCVTLRPSAVPTRFKGLDETDEIEVSEPYTPYTPPEANTEPELEPDTLDLAQTVSIPSTYDVNESALIESQKFTKRQSSDGAEGVEPSTSQRLKDLSIGEDVEPLTIEETPSTVCLHSMAHDHNYSYPTCPKIMRKRFITQARHIHDLQRSASRSRYRYRKLKLKYGMLKDVSKLLVV